MLPEKDGKDTAVVVKQRDGQAVLTEPYAASTLTTAGPRPYTSSPQEVQALFGAALAAQPSRPVRFTLQFIESKDELTEESKQARRGGVRGNPRSAPFPMSWSSGTPTLSAATNTTTCCRVSAPKSSGPPW